MGNRGLCDDRMRTCPRALARQKKRLEFACGVANSPFRVATLRPKLQIAVAWNPSPTGGMKPPTDGANRCYMDHDTCSHKG
jgi:hypothetical protein